MHNSSLWIFFILHTVTWSWSSRKLSLQTGTSITIPCHYEKTYKHYKKYWCYHAGASFNYCNIIGYTNSTTEKLTVTDDPDQSLFTVTMKDLQTGDTGMYWCAVEIGGQSDAKEDMYITVKSDADVSVVESSVSGQVGGSVSVQCLYSDSYKNKQKQWCRAKDWSCYTVGRTDTSHNSAVQISDDGRRSITVEKNGLKKSDAGWYWCYIGDLQIPVHLSISERTADYIVMAVFLTVLVLLILLAGAAVWILRKKQQTCDQHLKSEVEEGKPADRHTDDLELFYSSVVFTADNNKLKQKNQRDQTYTPPEDPVTYSNLTDIKLKMES